MIIELPIYVPEFFEEGTIISFDYVKGKKGSYWPEWVTRKNFIKHGRRKLLSVLVVYCADMSMTNALASYFDTMGVKWTILGEHPLENQSYIRTFYRANDKNPSQLVVFTHDSSLFEEYNLLRNDQVWFIDKSEKKDGKMQLYSLSDFDLKKDGKTRQQKYLLGSFGGIPKQLDEEF